MLGDYVHDQGYDLRFAIEPKPNEPRGDLWLPTVGHALHFITTLQRPEMVGVNPEAAHETMAGLSFHQAVGQALWAGKLFHIDLNAQRVGRYDQDFRFGAEDLKEAFMLVRLLERAGYEGPRHFDAHAYRNEDDAGVWEFARGCIRSYRALAEKAAHFDSLPEVAEALQAAGATELGTSTLGAGGRSRGAEGAVDDARRARRSRLRQRAAGPARRRRAARAAVAGGRPAPAARRSRRFQDKSRPGGNVSPSRPPHGPRRRSPRRRPRPNPPGSCCARAARRCCRASPRR